MRGLDFETFGRVDLPKRGSDNYFNDPSFRPLIASVARRTSPDVIRVTRCDFIQNPEAIKQLNVAIFDEVLVAQNASFERKALQHLSLQGSFKDIIDSAVIARAVGAASKLEAAAPQLVNVNKMESGLDLIKKFSMPQKDGYVFIEHLEDWSEQDWKDWQQFGDYCDLDAELSLRIAETYHECILELEWDFEKLTQRINDRGWPVDMDLVKRMQAQYEENLKTVLQEFVQKHDAEEKLNFRSTPQLRTWCKERGVIAKSFDEQHTAKLLTRVEKRLQSTALNERQRENYTAVRDMLTTKKELGGSSLSKLETIQNLVGSDHILRDQYLHVGAGQTFRTSGRGVQMQNLKRLGPQVDDVDMPLDLWTNEQLARNIRQLFTAQTPDGVLIVGDLSSIESRGLAFLAGDHIKLDHYRQNQDLYKVLAASMFHTTYEDVTKEQRQIGKVGELSCGYGAGAGAVATFAEKMGLVLTEPEARDIVDKWRGSNMKIVRFWKDLDQMLHDVIEHGPMSRSLTLDSGSELCIVITKILAPVTLRRQMPNAVTLQVSLEYYGRPIMHRWFQGCFMVGNDICYHKPSQLKSGKLWLDRWTKDGQSGRYKLYGGKLAGILTQSFCRELFFRMMLRLDQRLESVPNASIIGQFHDEIVVNYTPSNEAGAMPLHVIKDMMYQEMTQAPHFCSSLPVEAEIKSAYRYIK